MLAKLGRRSSGERDIPLSGVGANETTGLSIYDWSKMFAPGSPVFFGGMGYQGYKISGGAPGGETFTNSAPVFALESIRIQLFCEARFQWQQMRGGRPGDLFGNADLKFLYEPWPGATTSDLLGLSEMDIFGSGNSYWTLNSDGFVRLDPSNVKLLIGRATDDLVSGVQIGDRLEGYALLEGRKVVKIFAPDEVFHYKPYPDPKNPFLGVSWLSPCLPDVALDKTVSDHKTAVLNNGGQLQTVVTVDQNTSKEQFDTLVDKFRRQHEGPTNAARTLFIQGGTDVKTVGQSFESLALQATQGSLEVRIASCAGVPPAIVGISEGLKGSSLNAGNYGEARRRLTDMTFRPLWRTFAAQMQTILKPPGGARLWYDDRDIAFLREDLKDQADILAENAKSVMVLIQAGYQPDAAVEAVQTTDLGRLTGKHTGLFSVQLQPPLDGTMPNPDLAPAAQPALPAANGDQPPPNGQLELFVEAFEERTQALLDRPIPPIYVTSPEVRPIIQVQPANFTAPEVNVHVAPAEAPEINVAAPEVRIEYTPPDVNFTAPDVTVHVAAPEVNVAPPEVNVDVAAPDVTVQPADVHVTAPDVHVAAPVVNVEAPTVNVEAPEVRVEAPAVEVQVDAPVVHVKPPEVRIGSPILKVPRRKVRRTIERDASGVATGMIEEELNDDIEERDDGDDDT